MNWPSIQTQLETWCEQYPELLAVYLFGSQAEGRAGPRSDVDLALLARLDLPRPFLWRREDQWASELSRLLAPHCTADVFVLNLAPLSVRFQVITLGRILWTSDALAVSDFESYTRRRYWDLSPYQEAYQRNLETRIKESWNATQREQYRKALEQTRAIHRRIEEAAKAKP